MTHAAWLTLAIGGGLIYCGACFKYGWEMGKQQVADMAVEFLDMLKQAEDR